MFKQNWSNYIFIYSVAILVALFNSCSSQDAISPNILANINSIVGYDNQVTGDQLAQGKSNSEISLNPFFDNLESPLSDSSSAVQLDGKSGSVSDLFAINGAENSKEPESLDGKSSDTANSMQSGLSEVKEPVASSIDLLGSDNSEQFDGKSAVIKFTIAPSNAEDQSNLIELNPTGSEASLEGKSGNEASEGKFESSEANLDDSPLEGKSEESSAIDKNGDSMAINEKESVSDNAANEQLEGKSDSALVAPEGAQASPPFKPSYITESPCCPACCSSAKVATVVKCCGQEVPILHPFAVSPWTKILLTPISMPISVGLKAAKFGATIPAVVANKGAILSSSIGGPIILASVSAPPLASGAVSGLFSVPEYLWRLAEVNHPIIDVTRK